MILLTPEGPWNLHKIACSEMEDSMLHFEGDLVKKKDRFRQMMLDAGPSERMEREAVVSELEMTLIDNLYRQEHSVNYSVDGSLA